MINKTDKTGDKNDCLNFRVNLINRNDFSKSCEREGINASAELTDFIVETINDGKIPAIYATKDKKNAKDSNFQVRINADLKASFLNICATDNVNYSTVLSELMDYKADKYRQSMFSNTNKYKPPQVKWIVASIITNIMLGDNEETTLDNMCKEIADKYNINLNFPQYFVKDIYKKYCAGKKSELEAKQNVIIEFFSK